MSYWINLFALAVICGVFASTSLAGVESNPTAEAQDAFVAGMVAYIEDGDIKLSRNLLEESLAASPNFAAPKYNLGLLAEAEEDWDAAIKWYSTFLKESPQSRYAVRARVKLERLKGLLEQDSTPEGKAQRRFLEAVQSAGDHLSNGRPGDALAYAEVAMEAGPDRFEGYFIAATAFEMVGGFADARRLYEEAKSRAEPLISAEIAAKLVALSRDEHIDQRLRKADEAAAAARYLQAARIYQEVWESEPDMTRVGLSAAVALLAAGEAAEGRLLLGRLSVADDPEVAKDAADHLTRLRRLEPAFGDGTLPTQLPGAEHYNRGLFLLDAEKPYFAEAEFDKALFGVMPPEGYADYFFARARARRAQGDHMGASLDLTMALVLKPGWIEAHRLRGDSYARLGDIVGCARDYHRAVELSDSEEQKSQLREEMQRITAESSR